MADIAISSGDYLRPYRSPWGSFPIKSAIESTGASFILGDVIEFSTKVSTNYHRVERASTSGSTCISTSIVGVAAAAASSVQGTKIPYWEPNPNVEFWGRTRGGTLQSTCVNSCYGLFRDSSKNVWLVDFGNSVDTSVRVMVTELVDAVGDSGGAVLFKFGSTNSTLGAIALQPRG